MIRRADWRLQVDSRCFLQATSPLVEYYAKKGVVETFSGTQSDVIYPQVKQWLEEKTGEY